MNVLIIDDDREIALGASMRLRAAGYQTWCAADGPSGLSLARERDPDAIILDVRMPRMNGLEVLAELRRSPELRDTPVIMLSASVVDTQDALDQGARFFLTKPYDGNQLVSAVATAIAESQTESLSIALDPAMKATP